MTTMSPPLRNSRSGMTHCRQPGWREMGSSGDLLFSLHLHGTLILSSASLLTHDYPHHSPSLTTTPLIMSLANIYLHPHLVLLVLSPHPPLHPVSCVLHPVSSCSLCSCPCVFFVMSSWFPPSASCTLAFISFTGP